MPRKDQRIEQLVRIWDNGGNPIVYAANLAFLTNGEIEEFEKRKILLFRGYRDEIQCNKCYKGGCTVPLKRVEYPDGQKKGVCICPDPEQGDRLEFELEELRYWEVNRDELIELGYYQETKNNRGEPGKKTKKQAGKKKHFEHWPSPGDACFIIENERINFHYDGKIEDLKLKKDSNADRLVKYLQSPVSGKIVKQVLCSRGTRPSDLKDQANDQLNKKIVAVGFIMPRNNIEFIRYVDTRNEYECVLEIHPSRDDFMRSELEQPLVDDQKFKDLDTAEERY